MENNITIELNAEQLATLRTLAEQAGTSLQAYVEDLVTRAVEQKRQHDLEQAMKHVLSRNHELYKRLS